MTTPVQEARRLLQAQGIATPTGGQVNTQALKIKQERSLAEAKQNMAATKTKAQMGPTRSISIPTPAPAPLSSSVQPQAPMRNISFSNDLTAPSFKLQLQQIMMNRMAAKNAPIQAAGRQIAGSLATLPETTAAIPGFAGLSLDQGRQLQNIEEGGLRSVFEGLSGTLERRGTRMRELGDMAGEAFQSSQAQRQRKEDQLTARRQSAVNEYLNFQQKIIGAGGKPDQKAGQDLIARIQASSNPEGDIASYFSTAAPFVKDLFAPKKTGGSGSAGFDLSALLGASSGAGALTAEQQRLLDLGGQAQQALESTKKIGQGIQGAANSTAGKIVGSIPGVGQALRQFGTSLGSGLEQDAKNRLGESSTPSALPEPQVESSSEDFLAGAIQAGLIKPKQKDLEALFKKDPAAATSLINKITGAKAEPKDRTLFNSIVNNYSKSPLIQSSDKMQGYLATIKSAAQGQTTPQKDLSLIYSYIKALDYGESAVREGEINLGANLGSIKQQLEAVAAKLGGTGLLGDSARKNYIQAAEQLINSINAGAKQKEKMFEAQANTLGVGSEWKDFRKQFAPGYDTSTQFGTANEILSKYGVK